MSGQGEARTSARRLGIAAKTKKAMEMRMAGATFDEIAEALGYADRSGPFRAVDRALRATREEPADHLRSLELARLEALHKAVWPLAIGHESQDVTVPPDLTAVRRAQTLSESRRKLVGLDAPDRQEITGAEGGPIEITEARAVLNARVARIVERGRKGGGSRRAK